jgi:hypothetical protein
MENEIGQLLLYTPESGVKVHLWGLLMSLELAKLLVVGTI